MTAPRPAAAPVRLTEWTSCGGCAAKWGAGALASLVRSLEGTADDALLVALGPSDDAAVYRLTDDLALVSTTDFFPPLVDDAADFGAIAAANACSDVFAMGGRVVMALNLAAFPEALPGEVVAAILMEAARVVEAAGGTVAGGHTIRSDEPIFGLAVQGLVHPERILAKGGAQPGDVVVLSKPLGTGLVLAGAPPEHVAAAVASMRSLNRAASEALVALGAAVHSATDVTGFGLAGHAWEVAERSGVEIRIDTGALPLLGGALEAAGRGVRTGGDARNREHLAGRVRSRTSEALDAVCHDPQTSGGLLAAVEPSAVDDLADAGFVAIGEVVRAPAAVALA